MPKNTKTKREVIRLRGRLREIVTVSDEKGNILHKIMNPLMVEFYPRDVLQVMVGAAILAIPVGFTEETWNLGETLPLINVIGILMMSVLFIASFVYYNYYRNRMREHWREFIKRVFSTYLLSSLVVAVVLSLIQRAPWHTDIITAFKRVVLVTFPSSMSAVVADIIK